MSETFFSVIDDALFALDGADVDAETLPGVLARLSRGERLGFARLAAHQQQGWHQFLVQLAVLALECGGRTGPPEDAATWRGLLLDLSGGKAEPWALVVGDLSQPAFLQPPVTEGTLKAFKGPLTTPDELDVPITAKNHDIKAARLGRAAPEHWLYALLTLQTQQGFLGAGNYGVSRMNTGSGSRPLFAFSSSVDAADRFRHDIAAWRRGLAEPDAGMLGNPDGPGLLWLAPWNDDAPFTVDRLHPAYIEVCRRVRLTPTGGGLLAWTLPTKAARVSAKELKGCVGDPWIPVSDAAALTVPGSGLHYTRLCEVLFGAKDGKPYVLPACMKALPEDAGANLTLIAQVLVRGQGKTEGLHQRVLVLPAKVRRLMSARPATVGDVAKRQMQEADAMLKTLRYAVCVFVQGAPAKADGADKAAGQWRDRYDRSIDDAFFDHLWEAAAGAQDAIDAAILDWQRFLRDTGKDLLEAVFVGAPTVDVRRYRAIAAAEAVFAAGWRKHLPILRDHVGDPATETPQTDIDLGLPT